MSNSRLKSKKSHDIVVNIYGMNVLLRASNKAILTAIFDNCLPFFTIVQNRKKYSFFLTIHCMPENVNEKIEKKKYLDPWICKGGRSHHVMESDAVIFSLTGTGLAWWNEGEAHLFLWRERPQYSNTLKYFFYTVLFDWLYRKGFFMIHGCVISFQKQGVLLLGDSGSGKSTLALYLSQNAFHCLGDNVVCVKKEGDSFYMYPFLRYISLTKNDAIINPQLSLLINKKKYVCRKPDKLSFSVSDIDKKAKLQRIKLAAIVSLHNNDKRAIMIKQDSKKTVGQQIQSNIAQMILGARYGSKEEEVRKFSFEFAKLGISHYGIYFKKERKSIELVGREIRNLLKKKHNRNMLNYVQ